MYVGLGMSKGTSALDCCTKCATKEWADKGCIAFGFAINHNTKKNTTDLECWFKKAQEGPKVDPNVISGRCDGPSPPTPPPSPPTPKPRPTPKPLTPVPVRNVFIMGAGNESFSKAKLEHNEFLTVKGSSIGPELGIGWGLDNYTNAPQMMLKSCIGNRALGWDLLPPGSPEFDYVRVKQRT